MEKNRSIPQIQFFPHIINFLDYIPFEVDLTTLPGKLKAYRHINGLSQKQLGKILGVNGATVCGWKLEENQPNNSILEKLDTMFVINIIIPPFFNNPVPRNIEFKTVFFRELTSISIVYFRIYSMRDARMHVFSDYFISGFP